MTAFVDPAAPAEEPTAPVPQAASIGPILILSIFIAMLLLTGIALAWPYLVEEHRRLEPWKIVGVWIGDVLALAWFATFAYRHIVRRIPLISRPITTRADWHWSTVATAAALGLCLDLGFTLYLIRADNSAYRNGQHTEALVYDVRQHAAQVRTIYMIRARFQDAHGQTHDCRFRAYEDRNPAAPSLPQSLRQPLSNGKKSFSLPIRYDASWPARCWIDGAGSFDGNDLTAFSLTTTILQAVFIAVFVGLVWMQCRRNHVPWWAPTYQLIPIAVEAAILPGIGLGVRAGWFR